MSTTVTYKGSTLTTVTNQTKTLTTQGKYLEDNITLVDVTSGGSPTLQTKTATYTPTESQQTATITADSGYDGLDEVDITVNAISSTYVGTGITRRSSSDLTASGATVTVPSGYYASNATKTVASGTEGTPTATKGTVSSHSITVTPSVTNTAGYISGGTHNGTAVTVSASELVSGSETKTANGTYDVTNLAQIIVNVSGGGGGGLEYEEGTWTPSTDIADYTISFTNTHTVAPVFYSVFVADDIGTNTASDNLGMTYFNNGQWFGVGASTNENKTVTQYAVLCQTYKSSATGSSYTCVRPTSPYNNSGDTNETYSRYWATETGIRAYSRSGARYWRAGRTYKWVAIWAPTT